MLAVSMRPEALGIPLDYRALRSRNSDMPNEVSVFGCTTNLRAIASLRIRQPEHYRALGFRALGL